MTSVSPAQLADASLSLTRTAAASRWRGADPYDGLGFNWPGPVRGGRRRRQVIMQAHARAPVDIRRLYRREHRLIPKTLGAFASAAMHLGDVSDADEARALALDALQIADEDRRAGPVAWGYPWDTQFRWTFYAAGDPNVVVTSFLGDAMLEAERRYGERGLGERARTAAGWVHDELWVEDGGFFAYHEGSTVNVHNASLLGAALVDGALGERARDRVWRAVDAALNDQRPDGAWPYGIGPGLEWVDSFHTGYVLNCLHRLRHVDERVPEAIARGAEHYRGFFDDTGDARLWRDKPWPKDGHSAGTGLSALSTLSSEGVVERELVERVAARTVQAGLHDGHAVFRRYRRYRTTVRYIRWCDAHVALGLADAARELAASG